MVNKFKKYTGMVILSLFLFAGCSAQKHMQIAQRKDPSLFKTVQDTVYVDTIKVDTIFKTSVDTVEIAQDLDSLIQAVISDSCKEEASKLIVPIYRYIDKIRFIDSPVTIKDSLVTDSVTLYISSTVYQNGDSIGLITTLDGLKFLYVRSEVTRVIEEDKKFLSRLSSNLKGVIAGFLVGLFLGAILRHLLR